MGEVQIYTVENLINILQRGLAGWIVQHPQPVLVTLTRTDRHWLRRSWEEQDCLTFQYPYIPTEEITA